jgi:hypothetical protein
MTTVSVESNPGGFLKRGTTLQRTGRENLIDLALPNLEASPRSKPRPSKAFTDIPQPAFITVEQVLRVSRAEKATGYL